MIHLELVPGDKMKITVLPKGGGCENMSRLAILLPGQGREGVVDFVLRAVEEASGNPCPPLVVGVGIGGTRGALHVAGQEGADTQGGRSEPRPGERRTWSGSCSRR